MPRKALRCSVELDVHTISCPGVYLPDRNDVYLSISLFRGHYRRTRVVIPIFPLVFHEKFRFDKVFFTAFEPKQVVDALESDHIRIELVQLSDLRPCGRLLACYEANARDFLYPYPQYSITYGCADREVLMQRTLDFPGIAPMLEFSTRTTLTEVDRPVGDASVDIGLLSDSCISYHPRSARSPTRRRSLSRGKSSRRRSVSPRRSLYRHRRPTIASISHYRSPSPTLSLRGSMRDLALYDSMIDSDEKPAFVVRKVTEDLIGRKPGTKHTITHKVCRSKSRSPCRFSADTCYHDDDWLLGRQYIVTHKVVREPGWSSDEYLSGSDVSETVIRPGTSTSYKVKRTVSPVLTRRSLRDRFEDRALTSMIELKVDDAIRRNRSLERPKYMDDDFKTIKDMERELEIMRNRSFVHMNDGEYWTQKAAEYKGQSHRELFNDNLKKVYSDMYTKSKAKTFDHRAY